MRPKSPPKRPHLLRYKLPNRLIRILPIQLTQHPIPTTTIPLLLIQEHMSQRLLRRYPLLGIYIQQILQQIPS